MIVTPAKKAEEDKAKQQKFEERANKSFQDAEADKNREALTKTVKEQEEIKISQDFVPVGNKKTQEISESLKGVFAVPKSPEEAEKEKSMKKDSAEIRSERKTRKDDRSWETLSNSRSKKY